jgi:Mor family transcriptional regulator
MEPTVSDRPEYLEDDAAVQLEVDIEEIIVEWIGMKPQLAGLHAKLIVQGMRDRLGGKRVYIPAPRLRRHMQEAQQSRDQQIAAMFNGRNIKDVMRVFSVSRRTVYNALARTRPKLCT